MISHPRKSEFNLSHTRENSVTWGVTTVSDMGASMICTIVVPLMWHCSLCVLSLYLKVRQMLTASYCSNDPHSAVWTWTVTGTHQNSLLPRREAREGDSPLSIPLSTSVRNKDRVSLCVLMETLTLTPPTITMKPKTASLPSSLELGDSGRHCSPQGSQLCQ